MTGPEKEGKNRKRERHHHELRFFPMFIALYTVAICYPYHIDVVLE